MIFLLYKFLYTNILLLSLWLKLVVNVKKVIPDKMGYASLFRAGSVDDLVLPKGLPGMLEWRSFLLMLMFVV